MLVCVYYVIDGTSRLRTMHSSIERDMTRIEQKKREAFDEKEINNYKTNFNGIALDILTALAECKEAYSGSYGVESNLTIASELIERSILIARDGSIEELKNSIGGLFETLDFITSATTNHTMSSTAYSYKERYLYEDINFDSMIIQSVFGRFKSTNQRDISFLTVSPSNRMYNIPTAIKEVIPTLKSYALGVDEGNGNIYRRNYDRVALGYVKGSIVTNDAFDILFLKPSITSEKHSERMLIKRERDAIRDSIKYLKAGGFMVLAFPYFRFHRDVALLIAKNFKNIEIRKTARTSDDDIVYLIGERIETIKEGYDKDVYSTLRRVYDISKVKHISIDPFSEKTFQEKQEEIKMFRGSVLDKEEMFEILESSPCMDEFWKAQGHEKISESSKSPLLPFNTGQIGLVLTSGCLDGIIDEGDGNYHIVKGRVVKKTDTERTYEEEGEVSLSETTSNRVEINILTPEGIHKRLA